MQFGVSTRLLVLLIALALLAGVVHADCGCNGGHLSDNPIDSYTFDSSPSNSGSPGGATSSGGNAGAADHSGGSSGGSDSSPATNNAIGSSSSDGSSAGGSSGGTLEDAVTSAIQGKALFRKGQYNESLELFNRSVREDPNLLQGWTGMGTVLSAMGRYNESAGAYMHAARIRPSDADSWRDAGDAYRMAGEFSPAVDAYTRALTAQPGKAGVQENLSIAKAALAQQQVVPGNATAPVPAGTLPREQIPPDTGNTPPAAIPGTTLSQPDASLAAGSPPSKTPVSPLILIFGLGCAFLAARREWKR